MSYQQHLAQIADDMLIDQNRIDSFVLPDDSVNIKEASNYRDELLNHLNSPENATGATLPWADTHDKVRFNEAGVHLWTGYNGHKKSMLTGFCAYHWIQQGLSGCIASLEMKPVVTLKRIAAQAVGYQELSEKSLDQFFPTIQNKLYLYDQQNNVPTERILKMAGYCGTELGLDFLVIDSLMKSGMSPDDYPAQKNFLNSLDSIAKDTGMDIHLVAHMRKPPNDKRYVPDRYDISGGSDISNQASSIFIVWTDVEKKTIKQKPDAFLTPEDHVVLNDPARWDVKLKVEKQRNSEYEGTIGLHFLEKSLQFQRKVPKFTKSYV